PTRRSSDLAGCNTDCSSTPVEEHCLYHVLVNEPVCTPRHEQREQSAHEPLHESVQKEGATDEPVSGTNQAHDSNLASSCKNAHANGGANDDDRDERENRSECKADGGGEISNLVQLLHPVFTVAHFLNAALTFQLNGNALNGCGIPGALVQPYLHGGGEEIGFEYVAEFAEFFARPGECGFA